MVEWGSVQVACKGPCQPTQTVGVWFCDVAQNGDLWGRWDQVGWSRCCWVSV